MRDVNYIVFDSDLKILHTSKWYDKTTHCAVCTGPFSSNKKDGIDYINVTHPKSKDILQKINDINGTDYA